MPSSRLSRPKSKKGQPVRQAPAGHMMGAAEKLEVLERILDNIYNGVMVTDPQGFITHFNSAYGKFLGVDPKEQIGKHCTDVVENSRMHIVAQTGIAEINKTHRIRGQDMVVQRIPIKKDGKIIAVYGQVMFKNVRDVGKLARKLSLLESKVELYEKELISLRSTRYTMDSIVGESKIIQTLKKEALRAASTHLPVLVSGESGTGKELFAQAIHHAGPRRLYPFVRINCAAIPRDLMESELFGYEQGAFTGALYKGKPGKFELAHMGTIFLDEIGDLPMEMQPKLLRVLEEKEFERLGGNSLIRVDFRLIAASNQNLEKMAEEGKFRKDLYYRLSVITLQIPPLRERRDDILPLTRRILYQIVQDMPLTEIKIDPQAERVFLKYDWSGNVRELSNVLEGICSSLEGDTITLADLPYRLHRGKGNAFKSDNFSLREVQHKSEKEAISYALAAARNNKRLASEMLGIHRTLLYKKLRKFGLT